MTSFDTNVADYTLSELMAIVNLSDLDPTDITNATNKYIQQYKTSDPTLSTFFQGVQSQLLQYSQGLTDDNSGTDATYPAGEQQTNDRYQNQYLTQSDPNQTSKITQRKQQTQVYGNQHVPMTREQLGVNDNYSVPVKQDSLNPNLKNTIERFVNLDSQFRQFGGNSSETVSTNYTLDLSDRLTNTIELKLYSYQIPNSWYVIDLFYRNTCFWINDGIHNIPISVEPGNYTQTQLVDSLNASFLNAGFSFNDLVQTFVSYNSSNGKLTIALFGANYANVETGVQFTVSTSTKIIFYDFTAVLLCEKTCTNNNFLNQTLGWIMGFRVTSTNVSATGNTGSAVVDLNGTKYLILVIDDYNQNRVNNSLVSITQLTGTFKMPNYYSPDLPYVCLPAGNSNLVFLEEDETNPNNGLLIAEKYNNDYAKTQIIVPSAPRTLTQSQIYTINEINKSKGAMSNSRPKAPTSSDIMAIIPLKGGGATIPTGTLLSEFSGSLQDNIRTYFGPVNIDRMAVKLLDDKGNILNLNGCDWCVTLIATCLYQY
jgi:hypothetical protein